MKPINIIIVIIVGMLLLSFVSSLMHDNIELKEELECTYLRLRESDSIIPIIYGENKKLKSELDWAKYQLNKKP